MLDVKALKIKMLTENYTVPQLARTIEVTPSTMYKRLRGVGEFNRKQIEVLIDKLDIKEPTEIFFNNKVS